MKATPDPTLSTLDRLDKLLTECIANCKEQLNKAKK
jgi:hypothetical protein